MELTQGGQYLTAAGALGLCVLIIGALLRSVFTGLQVSITTLTAEVRIFANNVASLNTAHAVTESRLNRVESDIAMLHGRVGRLVTDKLNATDGA